MEELKTKIEQALNSLDPENNGHWTKEGLPAVPFLSILVGGGVTRELVDEVGNGLTRELAKERAAQKAAEEAAKGSAKEQSAAEGNAAEGNSAEVKEPVQETPAKEATAEETFVFRVDGGALQFDVAHISGYGEQSIDEHLSQVRIVQDNLNTTLANLTALRMKVQEYADKVVTAIEEDRKVRPGADATTMYLQSRQKQLAQKAAELAGFREKGIGQLMKMVPRPSPLDQALARKR